MNIKPVTCRCGAAPLMDDVNPEEVTVYCPICGCSFSGPDRFSAVAAWNIMTSKFQINIKNFDPSEDNE